jgi:hypothetical protein
MTGGSRDIALAQAECLARMNKRYAVVRESGKTLVIADEFDPVLERRYLARSTFTDIRNFYHKPLPVDEDRSDTEGAWWLGHLDRRQYEGVIFAPGQDVPGYYNQWRGWAVEPCEGDWSLYQLHLLEVICESDPDLFAYVLAWLADGVQRPSARPGVALVFRGGRGVGKGAAVAPYSALFGQHAIQVSNPRHLIGNFNAHLEDCVVLFLDEALWAGDKVGEGVLKMLITEPILPVERKYHDVHFVKNHLHIIMASNSDWVVPAGVDERRFLVLDVDPRYQQDHDYFGRLADQMKNGGCAAMLYDLLRYDCSGVDLRQAPRTRALLEQKLLSLDPRDRWWYGKLISGNLLSSDEGWSPEVPKSQLHEDYVHELKLTGVMRARTETELGMWLVKMLGERLTMTRPTLGGRRVKCWIFPSLQECRALFDAMTDSKTDWPEPGPDVPRSAVALMPGALR